MLVILSASVAQGRCMYWRQTGGCDPNGPREPAFDRPCDHTILNGQSGFCECADGIRVSQVSCEHTPFTCTIECRRQRASAEPTCSDDTGECDAEPANASPKTTPLAEQPNASPKKTPLAEQPHVCLGWRQTKDCNPNGQRDVESDRPCSDTVPYGASGFCECRGTTDGEARRLRLSSCDHAPFSCASECERSAHYSCDGWRQTGNCSADGPREPSRDVPCDAIVPSGVSGYCECAGGTRRIARPPRCSADSEPDSCEEACRRGEGFYEILGLPEDSEASEQSIKKAFRQLVR